ncbi:MAG TPA: zf-HC2 domain-containing protein [Chloroflexota bacterium]|nr:zf-HC2 domain-containing protein [Chloroflexota bacterium]
MSEPLQTTHALDPALLSAYYDNALDDDERRVVEGHLARCSSCRERLAAYAALGGGIRAGVDLPVPATLDARIAALQRQRPAPARRAAPRPSAPAPRRPTGRTWPFRSVLAAVILVGLLAGTFLFGLPFLGGAGGPAVASALPCDDPTECAIAVSFTGPVDHAAVEQSFQINPTVPVTFTWQGNTLLVKPTQPLQASASYTVSLRLGTGSSGPSIPVIPARTATPVALHFVAGAAGAPVVMASRPTPVSSASPGVSAATTVKASPASVPANAPPTPTSAVAAAASATALAAVPVASSTPCPVQPTRGFGTLYQGQPAVATKLGCAGAPEATVDLVAEPFEHGRLLWRGDQRQIIALVSDGHWSSYPDTFDGTVTATPAPGEPVRGFGKVWHETPTLRAAIGNATAPEQPIGGEIEEFQHGMLVWTADRVIYALYSDGTWQQYADTYVDTTGTPTTTATATPTPTAGGSESATPTPAATETAGPPGSPTATPSPSGNAPSPTPSPAPAAGPGAACSIHPVRGFGLVYDGHPDVAARLGCASATEIGSGATRETFQHGLMIRRDDVRQIFVIRDDGTWFVYPDTYQNGEALPDVGAAPAGLFAPVGGLGKLWREQSGLRQALGWATAPEQGVSGAYQDFAAGRMVWTSDKTIYALYSDGTWKSFPDTFVDATPAPP